jgi:septum formation protein
MPLLVLASGSPRRAALLSERRFEFEIAPPRRAEKFDVAVTLRELTLWNAVRKGMSIAQTRPDAVVLAADTLVALENEIIGKPADLSEAAQTLQRLSGRTHEVCSAVLIYHQTSGRLSVFHDISRVRFHRLNRATIKQYIARVDPLDKAGAYAAQVARKSSRKSKAHSPTSSACQWKKQSPHWPNSAYGQRPMNDGFP